MYRDCRLAAVDISPPLLTDIPLQNCKPAIRCKNWKRLRVIGRHHGLLCIQKYGLYHQQMDQLPQSAT